MNTSPAPIETLSFEAALAELEQIVRSLESGQAPLEESISTYERGTALKKHCEKKLQQARMKVEQISVGPDGYVSAQSFLEE